MATIEVTTWAGLVDALTTGDDVKLLNNIDCNNEIPYGVEQRINILNNATIDGNGHVIRNLRTNINNPVAIFYDLNRNSSITFKSINFINLILDKELFQNSESSSTVYFNNCSFVGKRSTSAFTFWGSAEFTSCFINLPGKSDFINRNSPAAHYCWFRETPLTNVDNNLSFYSFKLDGCYVDGEYTGKVSGDNIRFDLLKTPSNFGNTQNVINLTLRSPDDNISTADITGANGICRSDIFTPDGTLLHPSLNNVYPNTILVTAEEMKNPQILFDKGFVDIVVTN